MFRSAATDDTRVVPGSVDGMAGALSHAIGNVKTAVGCATALRAGVAVELNVGDAVFRGDVIETGADGAVGIAFNDGTIFDLSASARLVLNEFVCEPSGTSNSALFSLARGAFAFIAGKVAKTGGLRIDTPFASIRGRAEGGGIGILSLAALAFSGTEEVQAAGVPLSDDDTITYASLDHGVFDIIRNGVVIQQAIDPGKTYIVDDAGNVTEIANSDSRMADLYTQQFATRGIAAMGQGPTGVGPGGSGAPTFEAPFQLQPINFIQPNNTGPQNFVSPSNDQAKSAFIFIPPPPEPAKPPTIIINSIDVAAPGVTFGASDIVNANVAKAGLTINGTTTEVDDGRTVTVTILDSQGNVIDTLTFTVTVTNNTWLVTILPKDVTALADGNYTVNATVSVAGGTAQASHTIAVDETPPAATFDTVSFTGVQGDHITNNGHVTLSGTVSDNVTVSQVQVFNGTTLIGTASVDNVNHTWTLTTTLAQGSYNQLNATATDEAGNTTNATTPQTVQVDTTAPAITIGTIAGDNLVNASEASAGFAISGTESGADGQTVTVKILNSHGNAVDTYTTTAAGGIWSVSVTSAQARALADGSYTVTADVSDAAGNPAPEATKAIAVEERVDTVTITGAPAVGQTVIATFNDVDDNDISELAFQWYRDGVAISGATHATYKVTSSDAGHSLSVLATEGSSEHFTSASVTVVSSQLGWKNNVDGNWINQGNWNSSSNVDVTAADDALINANSSNGHPYTVTIDGTPNSSTGSTVAVAHSLTVTDPNATVLDTINSKNGTTGDLNLGGGIGGLTIASGIFGLWGGTLEAASIYIQGGGTLSTKGDYILSETIWNDGKVEVATGTLKMVGIFAGAGTWQVDSGAGLEFVGANITMNVTFNNNVANSFGTLVLDHAKTYSGAISNFAGTGSSQSDKIDLKDIAFDSGTTWSYHDNAGSNTGGTLTILENGSTVDRITFANGNYTSASFHLATDGNGGTLITDPPPDSGTATIASGGTLQLAGANSLNVIFAGSTGTLVLGDPADFTGTISANSGKLSSGDGIDLTNINSTAAKVGSVDYDHAANVTAVAITDGQHTDTIKLAGDYTKSTWTLSSDGSGGTMVVDPPPSTAAVQPPPAQSLSVATAELGAHGNDLFVFNANFGRDVVSGFGQAHDSMRVDQTVFQTVTETLTNAAQAGYEASTALGQNHDAGLTNLQKDKSPTDFIVHIFHS